jgi:hypothetical protein
MKDILVAVQSFFKREGIRYKRTRFAGVLQCGFAGENGCFLGYVKVDEEHRIIQIRTLSPVRVPQNKISDVAELLARINRRLLLATLELDVDDGVVASRTSIILGESDLHHDVMGHLLFANWQAMDEYFPAVNAVIFGNLSTRQAIEGVRRQRPDDPDKATRDEPLGGRLRDIVHGSAN